MYLKKNVSKDYILYYKKLILNYMLDSNYNLETKANEILYQFFFCGEVDEALSFFTKYISDKESTIILISSISNIIEQFEYGANWFFALLQSNNCTTKLFHYLIDDILPPTCSWIFHRTKKDYMQTIFNSAITLLSEKCENEPTSELNFISLGRFCTFAANTYSAQYSEVAAEYAKLAIDIYNDPMVKSSKLYTNDLEMTTLYVLGKISLNEYDLQTAIDCFTTVNNYNSENYKTSKSVYDATQYARTNQFLCKIYWHQRNKSKASIYAEKVLELIDGKDNPNNLEGNARRILSLCAFSYGNKSEALVHLEKAIALNEKAIQKSLFNIDILLELLSCYNLQTNMYIKQNDWKNAEVFLKKSDNLLSLLDDSFYSEYSIALISAETYDNLGLFSIKKDNTLQCVKIYEKVLNLLKPFLNEKRIDSSLLQCLNHSIYFLGRHYYSIGEYEKSYNIYDLFIRYINLFDFGDPLLESFWLHISNLYFDAGWYYYVTKHYDKAKNSLLDAKRYIDIYSTSYDNLTIQLLDNINNLLKSI